MNCNVNKNSMHAVMVIVGTLIVSSLFCFSCIPDPLGVDNIPKVKPQIVVSTQIVPGRSLVVLLTKSFGALEASEDTDPLQLLSQIAIGDASVTVTGDGKTFQLINMGNGFYGDVPIPFQPEETYTLNVVSQSLGTVHATTTVKSRIQFNNINATLYYNNFDDTLAQITHEIQDPGGKNWYMLNVQEVERKDIVENLLNPRAFTRLLDDYAFEGQLYKEVFRVIPRDYRKGDTIAVSLSNISAEYYYFMKLRQDNRFSFVEFLGEPINYPSNVVGGKGFFNLYIPDIRFFVLE
jgi:hypothetical protein